MTYITWKERQTNSSPFEKTLSLKSEKYQSAKNGVFLANTKIIYLLEKCFTIQKDAKNSPFNCLNMLLSSFEGNFKVEIMYHEIF